MSWGIQYVIDKQGAVRSNNYPYHASNGKCQESDFTKADRYCKPKELINFPPGSYDDLINALDDGPVAVGVNAGAWHSYSSGVLSAKDCTGPMTAINHGVVAVGWGTENGVDYWLLRNSWGTRWGESGHLKIERNKNGLTEDNACAILELNSQP